LNKEGQLADGNDDCTCGKGLHDNVSNGDIADDDSLCLTTGFFDFNYANTSQKPEANVNSPDDRITTADKLRAIVCEKKFECTDKVYFAEHFQSVTHNLLILFIDS
jgi:hypothetical protein